MQNRFDLLVADVMPIYMIMPRYSHNYALFYQLLDSNLFTHRNTYAILREATSETYGPGSILYYINLPSTSYFCPPFILQSLLCNLYRKNTKKYLSYYLYQISLLQVAVKALSTPLSHWLQGSYLFVQVQGI